MRELHRNVKFRLGKILDQQVKIKFSNAFVYSLRLSSEAWKKAKETLDYNIRFEILMAGHDSQEINDKQFGSQAVDLVYFHFPLIYQTSSREK